MAKAYKDRSLHAFERALEEHQEELRGDKIVSGHLDGLYDKLLIENLMRIIEPYSVVELSHIASKIELPLSMVETKLSQMILDKKFKGILDAGAGCLIVYDDKGSDETYESALETLRNMDRVVDALSLKANKIVAKPEPEKEEDKKEGKEEEGKGKDKKDEKEKENKKAKK